MDKCKNAYNPSKVSMYIDSQKNKTLMDNYYTIEEINDILDGKIDLDSVYTKDETYNRGELYTREEVEYLLSLKANKVDVYSKIDMNTLLSLKANKNEIYDKNKIDEILGSYYTKIEIDTILENKADKADVIAISGQVLTNIEDIEYLEENKQDKLIAGDNITISGNVISADLNDYLTIVDATDTYETIENVNSLSDIVSGHTRDISNKADKDITLSGYGITDAYTKTEIDNKISAVFRYKGSVSTLVELNALTGMVVGDVYNVTATGDNYAWTGTLWDKLSGEIDLSAYLKTEDAATIYETIENVQILSNTVSGQTGYISDLETNKADKADVIAISGQVLTNIEDISDLKTNKQDNLTAGENIVISDNVISADLNDYLTIDGAINTYETIANVNSLSDIVSGNTGDIESLEANKANTLHTHIKSEVGLSNVDNTSDLTKPISTATQTALNSKANTSHTHTKAEVGLANVDNTSDINKPISNATQLALNSKANTVHTHTKSQVELENVDNTSDVNKPISNATQTALNSKAPITGVPNQFIIGRTYNNVFNKYFNTSPTQILIKTGCNMAISSAIIVKISGYVHYSASIIDLQLMVRFSGGIFAYFKCLNSGPFNPNIQAFTYVDGGVTKLGFSFKEYLSNTTLNISVEDEFGTYVSSGWSSEDNAATGTYFTLTNPLNPSYVSNFASKINGVTYNGLSDITIQDITKAPTVHTHTKSEVGLANVDNTSDANKPISNATQTALNGKANTSHTHTKSEVGLSNVDNTSDLTKPISTATQTALNNKANTSHTHIKSEVGLANVDNTSDSAKPVSTATQTALNSKADKADTLSGYGITDAYTKTEIDINSENYKTYSGFENRADSTISIDETTGVFTLAPTTTSFNVWTNGTGKHIITTTQTVTITDDQTITYIYIDSNGTLQKSITAWNIKNGENAPCSIIFKDGTHYTITNERHSYDRNREWHNWAHNNIGAMYHHGLVGTFTNNTLSITQGVIADEDITFDTLNTKTKASLWYRNGASGMRMVRNSSTPYSLNGTTIQYDNGSGTLQPVGNNKYTCSWVYCSNDSEEPIYVVIGQNQYNTQTLALNASGPIINLSTAEWKLLYKVIYQNKSGVATYVQTVDYRTVQTGVATTPVSPTSHTGLTERDAANSHPATAISITPPSGYTSVEVDGIVTEIVTRIGITNILYADLLTLINNDELIPGLSYRITNYTTTTVQADTTSAGHDFDIIVTALSTNELSENAKCVRKSGDTYFTNAKLEVWEIKYCIDNDTSRFAWADTENGKGVIYYMQDEWNNECPYDFKNIQFKKSNVFLYTFGGTTDNSLTGGCHHNTMMDYMSGSILTLNFNTFGSGCYSNTFGNDCYSNTFGNDCGSNTFGKDCGSNTFGIECNSNTFGNSCYSNTFGNSCYSNTFGDYCYSNTFGNDCTSNTFGDYCSSNTFGNDCYSNTFGNDCYSNNFYHGTSGTTKKDYIRYITLEDGVKYNNFYSTLTTSYSSYLQRIRIKGLEYITPTNTIITLPTNTKYEWVIASNSSGVIKQYCPEDLVP